MKIDVQNYNQISVMTLHGEFTHEALKAFEDVVSSLLADKKIIGLVLDMSKVALLDSKSLEALLDLNEKCHENLRQLKLAGLDETCRKIMEITRLLNQFDAYEDLSQAVRSFA